MSKRWIRVLKNVPGKITWQFSNQTSCIVRNTSVCQRITPVGWCKLFSTSEQRGEISDKPKKSQFLSYNDIVYPPQKPGLPPRPAEVCHEKEVVIYSKKKLWYLALMVRGKSVDDAIKQLEFYDRQKGAKIIIQMIKEAQDMAVRSHNVEYKSNLWIEQLFARKSIKFPAQVHQGRRAYFKTKCFASVYIRLREGKPPKQYYKDLQTGNEKLEEYITSLRNRTVHRGL